ncbi:MAG: acyltransferase family protein [Rhodanobacteraceae bacterium]
MTQALSLQRLAATTSPAGEEGYRRDIDGLRAIAVLGVVAFHAFPTLLPGGFSGVDIFFVISGYLITGVIERRIGAGRFTFADFYARRMKRILPALVVVLAACFAFGWFSLLPAEYEQLGKHIAAGTAFVSNFALWSESGYFDADAYAKPLLHLWSLGIEEQFYLVWPLALWACARFRRSALLLVVAIGAISFAINLATVAAHPVAAFYSPLSRFWELQVGCALALLGARALPPSRRFADALSIAGVMLIAVSFVLLDAKLGYPGIWALAPTLGAFLIILSGPDGWFSRAVLSRSAFVGIGLVSYPLYLWHWPLLSFAHIAVNGMPSAGVRIALVAAAIVLATATYALVEKPIRFGRAARRYKVPVLATASLAIGAIGVYTLTHGGIRDRFPADALAVADWRYDYLTDARYPKCWVSKDHAFDAFAPFCAGERAAGRDLVVVWGDSHAARLYPGLKATFGDRVEIAQFNRDSCIPALGIAYPLCQQSNAWVVSEIARLQPSAVVMFAAWTHYRIDWREPSVAKASLLATIDALRLAGVPKILVVGPAPVWKGGLPKLALKAWLDARPFHEVPTYLATGLDPAVAVADADLRSALEAYGVEYFSITGLFCNDRGCLTHTDAGPTHFVIFDAAHLTTDGSTLIARDIDAKHLLP